MSYDEADALERSGYIKIHDPKVAFPGMAAAGRLAAACLDMLAPEAKEALELFLGQREYIDLLEEFPGAKLTPQVFIDHLRRLMPRLYSIASSPRMFPGQVHLTVAPVRYESNGRRRYGVCSTFLADRVTRRKTPVPIFVAESHFGVPADGAKDIIMIGPGTGVAPFRAFVQERVATGAPGRNWLFFGDQHAATEAWARRRRRTRRCVRRRQIHGGCLPRWPQHAKHRARTR